MAFQRVKVEGKSPSAPEAQPDPGFVDLDKEPVKPEAGGTSPTASSETVVRNNEDEIAMLPSESIRGRTFVPGVVEIIRSTQQEEKIKDKALDDLLKDKNDLENELNSKMAECRDDRERRKLQKIVAGPREILLRAILERQVEKLNRTNEQKIDFKDLLKGIEGRAEKRWEGEIKAWKDEKTKGGIAAEAINERIDTVKKEIFPHFTGQEMEKVYAVLEKEIAKKDLATVWNEAKDEKDRLKKIDEIVRLAQTASGKNFEHYRWEEEQKTGRKSWKKKELQEFMLKKAEEVLKNAIPVEEKVKSKKGSGEAPAPLELVENFLRPLEGLEAPDEAERGEGAIEKEIGKWKDDFQQGRMGYYIQTKIPKGKTFKGYTENHEGVEYYKEYFENEKMTGGTAGLIHKRTPGNSTGMFSKNADVGLFVIPVSVFKSRDVEKIVEVRSFWTPWKKEKRTVKREERVSVPLTFREMGVKDNNLDEKLVSFCINYVNSGEGMVEHRGPQTDIEFVVRESMAKKMIEMIRINPNDIWKIVEGFEPELLDLARPRRIHPNKVAIFESQNYSELKSQKNEPEIIG